MFLWNTLSFLIIFSYNFSFCGNISVNSPSKNSFRCVHRSKPFYRRPKLHIQSCWKLFNVSDISLRSQARKCVHFFSELGGKLLIESTVNSLKTPWRAPTLLPLKLFTPQTAFLFCSGTASCKCHSVCNVPVSLSALLWAQPWSLHLCSTP